MGYIDAMDYKGTEYEIKDSKAKRTQTPVQSPTASGTATAFVSDITQNEEGVITPTKANVPTASTSTAGLVKLNNSLTSTSTSQALTAAQGKSLNDNITKIRDGLSYVEDGTTIAANAAYTAGKFICWQGEMYRIKAPINATVTSGNWTTYLDKMDGMGGALSQINADLTSLNDSLAYSETQETACGTWNGETLYRQVFSGRKTDTEWNAIVNTGVHASHVKKLEVYCRSSAGDNTCVPYYVSENDMFRAAIQYYTLYAQLGNSYPAHSGSGALIIAVVYYTK